MNYKLGLVIFTFSIVLTSIASSSVVKYVDKGNDDELLDRLFFDFCYCNSSANVKDCGNYLSNVQIANDESNINSTHFENENECETNVDGPVDSPWPMKCHDLHHTGRSPYSTADNDGTEIWRFTTGGWIEASPVIGPDGTIYFGCFDCYFYAINPDSSLKWKYKMDNWIWSVPAIAEDGTIYIGSYDDYLYALYPSGTLKWKFNAGGSISSSPAIGDDGTIYFGTMRGFDKGDIFAVNPDGTEKWHYETGYKVVSDPAIGDDGTIYIGSGDTYFYAMNPDGTLKWRFKTGDWVKSHPSIAEDGTVYISSFDLFLYALYPNGTMKWKFDGSYGCASSASIDTDGTIYVGGKDQLLAINPDGTKKWSIDLEDGLGHSSPAVSADGVIFVGAGKSIFAINRDGVILWNKTIANNWVESSPCIGEDGTVYIGSSLDNDKGYSYGVLYAFGAGELKTDANGPYYGLVNEPVGFTGHATGGHKPYSWYWSFGDNSVSYEKNPTHIYGSPGNYTVTLTVTDDDGNTSTDTTWAWIQETNNPPNKPVLKGPTKGKPGQYYDYSFSAIDPENNNVYYYVDWGDGNEKEWFGPYTSGHEETLSHTWESKGTFTVRVKAKDVYGNESEWSSLEVKMPKSIPFDSFWQLLERLINRVQIVQYFFHFLE